MYKRQDKYEYCYENGIVDYIKEFVGDDAFSSVQFWQGERKGRDRADLPEYKAVSYTHLDVYKRQVNEL